jgi:post-segregation antitoxin (ccd killing protein)
MAKCHLTLYIDTDLVSLAKSSNMNISQEFEEWIKLRLGQTNEMKPVIDIDEEIAKHQVEIQKLKNQAELDKKMENIDEMKMATLDRIIDNMIEGKNDLLNPDDTRIHGIQFLFQKKYKELINALDAKELLLKRIKERGLDVQKTE